jgi:hypothetical protein
MPNKVGADARHMHSLLAGAMSDPILLERWRNNPRALRKMGPRAAALDINRVWGFSGLATKVRHNDVRLIAPLTFKLLDQAGVSIALFAAYARVADRMRKDGKKSAPEKLLSLSSFLEGWLDHSSPVHSLIWDLIRHESAILELQTGTERQSPVADHSVLRQVVVQSVPIRRGTVIHHEMSCNPVELARRLRVETRELASLPRGQYYFAYCHGSDSKRMKIVEIDAFGSVVLDLSDGYRTIGEIAALLHQAGIPMEAEDVCHAARELGRNGLIAVDSSSGA